MLYMTINSKGGHILAYSARLIKSMLFNEEDVLAHTSCVSLPLYKYTFLPTCSKQDQLTGIRLRKLKQLSKRPGDVPEKEHDVAAEEKDEYLFIQCEHSSYLIEKTLGRGERILVQRYYNTATGSTRHDHRHV